VTQENCLPVIASFWHGSNLSWIETLCIQSFLDRGHHFVLYAADKISGVPNGTDVRHAREIFWPAPFELKDNNLHRLQVFSNIFRLHLVKQTGFLWVDLAAYCVKPFDFNVPNIFAPFGSNFTNRVLCLEDNSPSLKAMIEFVQTPNPTKPWRGPRLHRRDAQRVEAGERWGIEALGLNCSGDPCFSHFLKQNGEDHLALPIETFYPLLSNDLWKLHSPEVLTEEIEREGVYSVHFFATQKAHIYRNLGGLPAPGSYLERLCERHRIDPQAQVISYPN
jgi:hypothetical protein